MANTDGALSFKAILDNGEMIAAIEETIRRVKGLSTETVKGGKILDDSFKRTADEINKAFATVDTGIGVHKSQIEKLKQEYREIGMAAKTSLDIKGGEYTTDRQRAIIGEINIREQLIKEFEKQADALRKEGNVLEESKRKAEENANAHQTLKARIEELTEQMTIHRQEYGDQTDEYKKKAVELGQLKDIQRDNATQGKTLSSDQIGFQGFISGLSGITGGFSAATSAVSLFAGENENLQKVMAKVQSLMTITIGLQQVSETLNKNSPFVLHTVRKAKQMLAAAEMKVATALGISNAAAKKMMATLTLGLSAAIAAVIFVVTKLSSAASQADEEMKKMQETLKEGRIQYAKTSLEIEDYISKIDALNGSKKKEKALIDELNKKYGTQLGYHESISQWKKVLTEKGQAYCEILLLEAQSQAVLNQYTDAYLRLQEKKDQKANYDQKGAWGKTWDNMQRMWTFEKDYWAQVQDAEKEVAEAEKKFEDVQKKIQEKRTESNIHAQEAPREFAKNNAKDPFVGKLEKRKAQYAEYAKWQNSTDADMRKAAATQFAQLIREGSNYEDFLRRLQAQISKEPRSNRTQEQLRAIRNELVELQNTSALEEFNKSLKNELDGAQDALQQIGIIVKMQNELANDGTDVDNSKKRTLDDAKQEALKAIADDYRKAQQEHKDYLDSKLKDTEQYIKQKKALEEKLKEAQTPTEKQAIQTRIQTLDTRFQGRQEQQYDQMLTTYRTFEQKRENIAAEFDEQIAIAREKKNKELEEQLMKAKQDALSKLAIEQMQQNPEWEKLFGNLDKLTVQELEKLLAKVDGQTSYLGVELNPKHLEVINEHVQKIKEEVRERNPFKALIGAIKDYGRVANNEQQKSSVKNMLNATAESIDLVKGGFDAIVGGIKQLGIETDQQTDQIINSVGGVLSGASQLAKGIASSNPLDIVKGSIDLISNGITLFSSKDRDASRAIRKHETNLKALQNSYQELEKAVDKALGSDRYDVVKNQIANLKKQQQELFEMTEAEKSKKKSDKNKVKEYEERQKQIEDKAKEHVERIRQDIMGIDARTAAEQLGNAFIDAFAKGEDAVAAFGKKTDEIVAGILRKMLIQKLLEEPIGKIIGHYSQKWFSEKGDFIGFDKVKEDVEEMGTQIKGVASVFTTSDGRNLLESITKTSGMDAGAGQSLSGAVKGVSEQTASMISGYLNAIRINQGLSSEILRDQLTLLNRIERNTAYNAHLDKLPRIVTLLEGLNGNSLRSQGYNNL